MERISTLSSQPPYGSDPDAPTVDGTLAAYPPPGAQPPPPIPPMPPRASATPVRSVGGGLAIAGLVLALLSMACLIGGIGLVLFRHAPGLAALTLFWGMPIGVIGIVFSAVGLAAANRRGSGTAGLVVSTLAVAFIALFLLGGLAAASARGLPGRLHPRQRPQPQGSGVPPIVRVHIPVTDSATS